MQRQSQLGAVKEVIVTRQTVYPKLEVVLKRTPNLPLQRLLSPHVVFDLNPNVNPNPSLFNTSCPSHAATQRSCILFGDVMPWKFDKTTRMFLCTVHLLVAFVMRSLNSTISFDDKGTSAMCVFSYHC